MDANSAACFEFTKLLKGSKKYEIWTFQDRIRDENDSKCFDITGSEVKEWLNKAPPKKKGVQSHVAGLRLIVQKKQLEEETMEQTKEQTTDQKIEQIIEQKQKGRYKIPFQEKTFEYLLNK